MSTPSTSSTTPLNSTGANDPSAYQSIEVHVSARTIMKILALVVLFYGGAVLAAELAPILLTVVIAAFFAVAADPLVRLLQRRGLGRTPAVLVFIAGLITVLLVLLSVFVPPLIEQGDRLVEAAPERLREFRRSETVQRLDQRFGLIDQATRQVAELPERVSSQLADLVGHIFSGVFTAFTILFLMVLMMLGGSTVVNGVAQLYPPIAERRWWTVVQDAYRSVGAYVGGTLAVATIAGMVMLVTLLVLGLPNPLPLALWMTLLAVVPLIGATIGALPSIVVAFTAGGVVKGLIMLGVVIVYQQVENSAIQPGILGRVVSLPPLVIFLAVLTGAQLQGVVGALLAVPLAGIAQIVVREAVLRSADTEVHLPPIAPDEVPAPPGGEPGESERADDRNP